MHLSISIIGNADAAWLGNALQSSSDINAVAIDAGFVAKYIAEIDANPKLHAALWLDCRIALRQFGLDGDPAFDGVHHARSLSV